MGWTLYRPYEINYVLCFTRVQNSKTDADQIFPFSFKKFKSCYEKKTNHSHDMNHAPSNRNGDACLFIDHHMST